MRFWTVIVRNCPGSKEEKRIGAIFVACFHWQLPLIIRKYSRA
jgi:hypothetical protein